MNNTEWKPNTELPKDWSDILYSVRGNIKIGRFNDTRNGVSFAEYTEGWDAEDIDFTEDEYESIRYEVQVSYEHAVDWTEVDYWMYIPELPKEA